MSERTRILVVDAGNTRVKWALCDGSVFVHENRCRSNELHHLDEQWEMLPLPDAVVIANVAGDATGARLEQSCSRWGVSPFWVSAQRAQCGVTNSYDDPGQLGPDRWAALIGAHSLSAANRVVVCMGTATTIDALTTEGVFLGGMILPGFDLMHESLASKTARLQDERGGFVAFPRSTRDAITTGAIRATCGAIDSMHDQMRGAGYERISVLATGGAVSAVSSACKHRLKLCDKLVLKGLVRIGQSLCA